MIDWIKSWFGQGRVRVEWTGFDDAGRILTGNAKAPYVGRWDEAAMISYIKQQLLYQHGVTVTRIQIIAHIEE
jgi:hypothetical protein